MPPFIPSKRRFSTLSPHAPPLRRVNKPSLFDTADKPDASATLNENKVFLDQLRSSEDDSSLSDVGTADYEDTPPSPQAKRAKIIHYEEGNEDEVDWEDALHHKITPSVTRAAGQSTDFLELTLDNGAHAGSSNHNRIKKKGPSKVERQIRISTHMMHVQFLLFHNLIRNGWTCDKEIQRILVSQIPSSVNKEITRWKAAVSLISDTVVDDEARIVKVGKRAQQNDRNQRDWGRSAERQEKGVPNMSGGDPTVRLLKILTTYWRKRFTITASGLRKQGYKALTILEQEIASYRNDKHNPEQHGERIASIADFRKLAQHCEGSRDVGAQLFTALIRGLGFEARLITSLQPIGFGWGKHEEVSANGMKFSKISSSDNADGLCSPGEESNVKITNAARKIPEKPSKDGRGTVRHGGARSAPIQLSESDGGTDTQSNDAASLIDVTPARTQANSHYDRDMPFPTYWTEVISPTTSEIIPVDPMILSPAVVLKPEHLVQFESKGAKADKAKLVFGYIIAFSLDGTAKDVTTRYLKRHMWPGRTKGIRIPIEKTPVYGEKGMIKNYENYDWFETVMSGYSRTPHMRTLVDDIEEAKDLKALKPEKKEPKANEGTLQGFKNSMEHVLERHLRREEALRPGSKPVRNFTTGKGDKLKVEPVYRRSDVEICRTGESWHKEGRAVKPDELPMKMVPVRAVTLTRKREVEEAERGGEKLKQGLYALHQTNWIIPAPIQNGVIPKNAFGNIDCYVPTMVPKGAVHIPLKNTVRICKRLGIDFAEAVTGFEFGKQRAVPVITGVVVAKEHEHVVLDEWGKAEEERRIKEEDKREKMVLGIWRRMLMGLRIIERVREEYGGDADAHEAMNPFTNPSKAKKTLQADTRGFIPNGFPSSRTDRKEDIGGGFFAVDHDTEGRDFLFYGHDKKEVRHGAGKLTFEDEKAPFDRGSLRESPSTQFDVMKSGTQNADGIDEALTEVYLDVKLNKTSKKGKKTGSITSGTPTNSRKRRTLSKRQATSKSETVTKSRLFAQESDKDEHSDLESLTRKEVAVKKTLERKSSKDVSGPSLRAKKGKS